MNDLSNSFRPRWGKGEGGQGVDEFFGSFIWGEFFWDDFLGLGWGGFLLDRDEDDDSTAKVDARKNHVFFESGIFVFLDT